MKKSSILGLVLCFLMMATTGFSQSDYDDQYYQPDGSYQSPDDRYSYEEFYDELSPYGSWVDYPQYGYVWVPRVSVDFHPYATEGHWVMTNYGWTWVSDYRWGWAAFHYGRWAYEPRFGWMWLPGRQWGPAWVAWRESDDYFGWAPLGPFGRISVNVSCPSDHYRFVSRRHFTDRNVYNYYSDRRQNVTIINNTRYINETHIVNKNKYFYGPRKDNVERAVGKPIRVANVSDRPKPDADYVDNDNVKVYRPRFESTSQNGKRSAPKKVEKVTDIQAIPTDRRLTPSVTQNTEGSSRDNRDGSRPQRQPQRTESSQGQPDATRQRMPNNDTRPQRQPQRTESTQEQPDATRQRMPNNEARPQRQPQRTESTQGQPDATRQQMPSRREQPAAQPKVEQPRREKPNTQAPNERKEAPQGKKNRGNDN